MTFLERFFLLEELLHLHKFSWVYTDTRVISYRSYGKTHQQLLLHKGKYEGKNEGKYASFKNINFGSLMMNINVMENGRLVGCGLRRQRQGVNRVSYRPAH